MSAPSPLRAAVVTAVVTAAASTAMPAWLAVLVAVVTVAGWLTGHPSRDQSLDALARTHHRIHQETDHG